MANIPKLPSGADLIAEDPQAHDGPRDFGPYCRVETDPVTGDRALAGQKSSTIIAIVHPSGGGIDVDLDRLNRLLSAQAHTASAIVPYLNRFIEGSGQKVEKYWRTKTYRLVGATALPEGITTVVTKGRKPLTPFFTPAMVTAATSVTPEKTSEGLTAFTNVAGTVTAAVEALASFDAEPEPEPEPVAKVPAVVGGTKATDIPGVVLLPKVAVKPAGKGYVKVGSIVTRESDLSTLRDAWALRQSGVPSAVLVTGPSGTAKTALVSAFAASLGVPLLKVDAGAIRTADDWAGAFRQDPNTKVWAHRWSPFAQVLRAGQPCIVLIDDITRTESVQALNAMIGLLDWTGSLLVPDANDVLTMPAGVLVIATANIGPEFVGTLPLDGAVRQRFPYGVRTDYPAPKIESALLADLTGVDKAVAERLVAMASMQRQNREDPQMYPSGQIISTRVLVDIARRITVCDASPSDAVWSSLRGQFDPGDETALTICVETQFPKVYDLDDPDDVTEVEDPGRWDCPRCLVSNNIAGDVPYCPRCGGNKPETEPDLFTLKP